MNKVAIATMTGGTNYGNALQNYAVLKLIEQCGYCPETLNITTTNGYPDANTEGNSIVKKLHPSYILTWYHTRLASQCGAKNDKDFKFASLRKLREEKRQWLEAIRKKEQTFHCFQKETLKYTDFEVNNLNFNLENVSQYAAFVTGSDQVWNPYYRTNSMVEFLQMAPKEKRIAFAPSFGVSKIPECRKSEYATWISEIPHLSVRESDGSKIIRELTGRAVPVLLDPTFGLTKEQWLEFAQSPKNRDIRPNTYVFCYFLGNRTRKYTRYINGYAKLHSCSIIDVYDTAQLNNYAFSPQEFVWLLANAKAVFTDSFHGCAFSINLQKPFVVFNRSGDGCITQSSRISTVLGKTGLEGRMFDRLPADKVDCIDFGCTIESLSKEREILHDFLAHSLKVATSTNPGITLATKRHCTGCGACKNACPKKAITMRQDDEGFLYPIIDATKCIKCHNCEKVCPADCTKPQKEDTKAFYAFSDTKQIQMSSSSGGVFTELAEKVISKGGIVYGAGYDNDFSVCHMPAENTEQLANLRTSKYVQSDTRDIFKDVAEQLKTGRQVLFSGTPCQIAALKKYLVIDYLNLILVDIVCHGVPSPGIWKKYLDQEHAHKQIQSISFRNKDLGWNNFSMKIEYADGSYYRELAVKDPFEKAFLANISLRPSCYQCQYKTIERVSDITIADYWGVETVHPELRNQEGVSLVLSHSERGLQVFSSVDNITWGRTDLKKSTDMNSACLHSVPWPTKRNDYFKLERNNGVKKSAEQCLRLSAKQSVKKFIIRNGSRVKKAMRRIGILK